MAGINKEYTFAKAGRAAIRLLAWYNIPPPVSRGIAGITKEYTFGKARRIFIKYHIILFRFFKFIVSPIFPKANIFIHSLPGRLLAYEWLKYRYGVFEETGHAHNSRSPSYYRSSDGEWKPTTCANVPSGGRFLLWEQRHFLPFGVRAEEKQGLTKSFMAFPELLTVTELCDEGSHDREAPTLHNLLCDGKSVWEVIRASTDFQSNRNGVADLKEGEVVFQYIQPQKPRIILLIEDTNVMNVQKRWDFMRKALKKFVTYDVPDGHSIGLVVFDSIAATKYPLTVLTDGAVREKVGSSLPRKPSREGQHKRCIICGLRESLNLLRQNGLGGHIVLVTAGNGILSEMEYLEAVEVLDNAHVSLHSIIYPLTEKYPKPAEGLEKLAAHTGGDTFIVPDEGIGADSKLRMYYNLLDAFYHTLSIALGHSVLPIKVHSAEHPGGRVPVSEGSFLMDPSLGSDTVFAIFYYDMTHVGNLVHLVSPHGQVIDTANMQKEDANINMITIRLMEAQVTSGLWHYKVENHADSHQALYVQVTSRPRSHAEASSIDLRAWTNHPSGVVNASDTTKPFALYTELMAGSRSIENAKIIATLSRLGNFNNGSQYPPLEVELLDNGFTGPDMIQGDGVYSRFVPSLRSAKYSMTVHVEGTLDGFTFSRHARIGTISIVGTPPVEDILPPSRIMDFHASLEPGSTSKVRFTWTAPGGDLDFDSADHYVVMISRSQQDLKEILGTTLEGWPLPLESYTQQEHTINWNIYDTVNYLALFAVDQNGNEGPLSNVVTVYVPSPPTTTSYPSSSVVPISSPNNSASKEDTSSPVLAALDTRQLAVLLGCLGGIIIVVSLILCYCKAVHHRHRKAAAAKKSGEPQDSYSVTVTISPKSTDFSDNKDSQQSLKKDYISPVESWSASQLLSNHSDNKRNSVSTNSDNSNQSAPAKKMYGDYTPGNDCSEANQYQYQYVAYPDHYQTSSEGFPTPTESYPTPSDEYPPPPEDYPSDYPPPSEVHSYVSSQPSDSFLSVSCDVLPSSHGPPAYAPYPAYDASLRSAKVPPPIPPKPKVLYTPEPYSTPEPYLYDAQSLDPHSSSLSVASDKRVRNVTMV
ncbi:LOW QUALITY PROTEIN: calcium-activated chloride channel regulator 1-like [Palaemon carinicauda]|uniref:LOW QUALITY PROTEIN: calcium-activated chloride channel regulator 1-like n=1 Tax=Palaemon carinicauda TaxID=392227 RepID=UPI0035B57598